MKKIGLIGGIGPRATMEYYAHINGLVQSKFGGYSSAEIVIASVNFENIVQAIHSDRWDIAANILVNAAKSLEKSGVELCAICSNTLHQVFDTVKKQVRVPVIHILDPMVELITDKKIKKLVLLGTNFTVGNKNYVMQLENRSGAMVMIPDLEDQKIINEVIFNELCWGTASAPSVEAVRIILEKMRNNGAQAVILGCTELFLLPANGLVSGGMLLIDSTQLHAERLASLAT